MSARARSDSTMRSLERDWELYADWCSVHEQPPIPAKREAVEAFFTEFPAAPSTLANRMRAIRERHEVVGVRGELDYPMEQVSTVIHTGEPGYATVEQALRQLPRARFWDAGHRGGPGLRGRRDAFLLVLLAVARLSRRRAQLLTEDQIETDPLRIAGIEIPYAEDTSSCARCAVTRWLRVVEHAVLGHTGTLTELLDPRVALTGDHDCEDPLGDGWRYTTPLLPAIDRHNWVVNTPGMVLSKRSISAIAHRLDWYTGISEAPYVQRDNTGRFADATSAELADAQDEMNDAIDSANDRILAILAEMETTDLLDDIRHEVDEDEEVASAIPVFFEDEPAH